MNFEIYDKKRLDGTVIRASSSKLGAVELLERLKRAGRSGVVQAFDADSVINRTHLVGAYLNAVAAFKEHRNIAKNMSMEMLLFAAMTTQIEDAIKLVGIKSTSNFILFANNQRAFEKVNEVLTGEKNFLPTKKHIKDAAVLFDIHSDYDKNILSKMALSRL